MFLPDSILIKKSSVCFEAFEVKSESSSEYDDENDDYQMSLSG